MRTMPMPPPVLLRYGLLTALLLGPAAALAQVTVEPQSLSVTVAQYGSETHAVTVTNDGDGPLTFCLSFDRPLQRSGPALRLADEAAAVAGSPCGDYGEVLHRIGDDNVDESGWLPHGLAMTPDGRLFTSTVSGLHRTFELTPDLEYVRYFEHPVVDEVGLRADTRGSAFDPDGGATASGSLWWLNEESDTALRRTLLLEGDLDGNATGRRIELPTEYDGTRLYSRGPSYDPASGLFYYMGALIDGSPTVVTRIWAVDRDGVVPEGYPRPQTAYPGGGIGHGLDAHGGAEGGPDGVRMEVGMMSDPQPHADFDRVVVLDRWGEGLGAELETPVPAEVLGPEYTGILANPLRSRLDPNGVMYMTFSGFYDTGVIAVRPHPLPPSWLVVDSEAGPEAAWDGVLAPGESRTLELTFRPGAREVGDYAASLQVFEAESGEAVEVPLTLMVVPGVNAEDGAAPEEASRLVVWPNPMRGAATVGLTLAEASDMRVVVFDVLGREVAVLHAGPLGAGEHALSFESAHLPAGVYLVRAEGGGLVASQRVTVVR